MIISLKMIEPAQKFLIRLFLDFDIYHRMAQLWKKGKKSSIPTTVTYFSRSIISIVNISEMVKASNDICHTTFIELNICQRMTALRKLYSWPSRLTYLFLGQLVHMLISLEGWALTPKCVNWVFKFWFSRMLEI